jgi:hypothetical protein
VPSVAYVDHLGMAADRWRRDRLRDHGGGRSYVSGNQPPTPTARGTSESGRSRLRTKPDRTPEKDPLSRSQFRWWKPISRRRRADVAAWRSVLPRRRSPGPGHR